MDTPNRPAFNLIDQPWIPCVMMDGSQKELGLSEVLASAHEVRMLFDSSPLVTSALHRLLLAILHRIFGPRNLSDWKMLWRSGQWDSSKLSAYLAQHQECFDLFHPERPFYQLAGFKTKKATPIKRLGWEFAAGNNATLFDHSWDDDRLALAPAVAARWVIATQTFAASAGKSETIHTKDSPWTRGAVLLMQGDTLFETLALNLLSLIKPDFPIFDDDKPAWETNEDWTPAHDQTPSGMLEYLTWQSRAIHLLPIDDGYVRECFFAQGRALRDDWRNDPMLAYKRNDKQGLIVWQFNEGRAAWRDSHALFNLAPNAPFQIPQSTRHLATLAYQGFIDQHRLYRLHILGQCLESGQPTIHFWRHERLPLRLEYLNDAALLEDLGKAMELTEQSAGDLQSSLWSLARILLAPDDSRQPDKKDAQRLVDSFGAIPHYWSQLEPRFKQLLNDLADGKDSLQSWACTLSDIAQAAFAIATRSLDQSSRALKAVAQAESVFRRKLRTTLADYLPEISHQQSTDRG